MSQLNRVVPERARTPWLLYLHGSALIVRGAVPRDLPAVALLHGRCSAKSLLDRYRAGGRPPAVIVLEKYVRDPLSFVVATEDGQIVGISRVSTDTSHSWGSAEISLLVEDNWQRLGIGRALLRHTAAAAAMARYRRLTAYPGTTLGTIQRLLSAVGTTCLAVQGERHLHTALPTTAKLGLGPLSDGGAAARAVRALG